MSEGNKETPQELLARLTGFTPGPWNVQASEYGNYVVCDRGYPAVTDGRPDGKANLELAAAAPDLHRIATEQAAEIARLRNLVSEMADSLDYYSPLTGRTIETPTSRTFRAALKLTT